MNPTVKVAAGVSVVVFGLIIAIFLRSDDPNNVDVEISDPQGGPQDPGGPSAGPGSDENPNPRGSDFIRTPPDRGSVEVSVEVRDKNTDQKLGNRGARVRVVRHADGDTSNNEQTDLWRDAPWAKSGRVSFSLKPGKYVIRGQASGYQTSTQVVTLVKDQQPLNLVFALERGNTIRGFVRDKQGAGIAGARVFAFKELADPDADMETILRRITELPDYTNTIHSETTSAADGSFELEGLENFWYTIRAVAPAFTPGEVLGVRAPANRPIEIVLEEGGLLAGAVSDESGNPVAGARVMAFPELEGAGLFEIILSKARPPVEEFTTGADGRYSLEALGAGLYNFLVIAPMFQEHQELKLRVQTGKNPDKNYTLKAGMGIEGYVRGPDDKPIEGARIRANAVGLGANRPRDQIRIEMKENDPVTDSGGYFKFDTLVDARYMLLVFHDDYESLQKKDVRPNGDPIEIRLQYGAIVRGRVIDSETGQPIPGAQLSGSDLANLRKEATTDTNGEFILSGLGSTRRPINVYVRADGYARDKRQVTVRRNKEYEENFELQATAMVEGIVVDSNDRPLPGAHIEVRPSESASATMRVLGNGQTESDGRFAIDNVEPGEALRVRVKLNAYLETYSADFALTSGTSADIGKIRLALGGEVKGSIVDTEGRPLGGVWIEARPEGGTDLTRGSSVQSDPSGNFLVRGLKAGNYDFIAKSKGFVDTEQKGIAVQESFQTTGVKIVLEKGGFLSGTVTDPDGNPVQSAQITVLDLGENFQQRRKVSDGKGYFEFNDIVAKDVVELEITHADYGEFAQKDVAVGTENLEVILKPLGSIVGVVLDPNGDPMDSFTVQPQPKNVAQKGKAKLRAKTFNPPDGKFEYRGIPNGVYSLFVRSLKFSAVTIDNVEIAAGEIVDVGEIQLAEGGNVSGVVVEAGTNQAIAGAKVRVIQGARAFQPGKATPQVITSPDGSFQISGLKDQVISLDVSHGSYATERVSGVDPRVGAKSQNLVVELEAPGEIVGSIVDGNNEPLKGMPIYLVGKGRGAKNDTRSSDASGNFHFQKVNPGVYTIRAHRFGKPGAQEEVQVFAGDRVEVRLQIAE